MDNLMEKILHMPPEEALSQMTDILGRLLADLDNETREQFLMNLIGKSEGDKVSGLVHL